MKRTYLECDCGSSEHVIVLTYFENDKDYLYISPHLSQENGFIKRLIIAVKYIFGHRSKYGDFGETLLNKKSVEKLKDLCNDFLE